MTFKEICNFYKSLIEELINNDYTFFKGEPFENNRMDFLMEEGFQYKNSNIIFKKGLTKLALISDNMNWILKVNLSEHTDFLHIEEKLYEDAIKDGFDQYFAKTIYAFTFYGRDYYLQEKCDIINPDLLLSKANISYQKIILGDVCNEDISCEDGESDETQMWYLFEDTYGKDEVEKFYDWCEEKEIYDLHSGNWSYLNNNLVILDYSGC